MKLTYDKETDTLLIVLKSKAIDETEEIRPGILASSQPEPTCTM